MITVIVYGGKNFDVDWVKYVTFDSKQEAVKFIRNNCKNEKYFSFAEFLDENTVLELYRPDDNDFEYMKNLEL